MKALATLFTLLLISNLIACSSIGQISINIEEELSLKVNDNSNMTLVNISYIEELVKDFEEVFWDNVSGGYYNAMYDDEISSTAKNFQAVYYSLRLYSLLYKETGKIEYLEEINELFATAEKFKDPDTELYYPIMDENFTEPYGSADIAKLSFTLDYGYSLIVAYNITKNSTFLERAIELSDNIFSHYFDSAYGGYGIPYMDTVLKDAGAESLAIRLNYFLFKITGESKYKERVIYSKDALEKMWHNGFYHSYFEDFHPFNEYRYGVGHVATSPMLGYGYAYLLLGDNHLLERALTLVNQTLFYYWDSIVGGYMYRLKEDFTVDVGDKMGYEIVQTTLLLYEMYKILSSIEGAEKFAKLVLRRVYGAIKLIYDRFLVDKEWLVSKVSRGLIVVDSTICSANQARFILLLETVKKYFAKDTYPPELNSLEIEGSIIKIRTADMEDGVKSVIIELNENTNEAEFDPESNVFVASIDSYKALSQSIKINITDWSGNSVSVKFELMLGGGWFIDIKVWIIAILLVFIIVYIILQYRKVEKGEEAQQL